MPNQQPSKRDWRKEIAKLAGEPEHLVMLMMSITVNPDELSSLIAHIREEAVNKIREDFIEWKSCGAMDERKEAEIEWDVDFMGWVKTREKLDTLKPKESL